MQPAHTRMHTRTHMLTHILNCYLAAQGYGSEYQERDGDYHEETVGEECFEVAWVDVDVDGWKDRRGLQRRVLIAERRRRRSSRR